MNKDYTFLMIPFFPYKPSVEQVIFVELGHNQLFNSELSKIQYKDEKVLYLPAVERKFHPNVSSDTFFSETLLQIDDLYCFLDSAKVGTIFTDEVCFGSDSFEIYDQSVNDVVKYGIMNYTGKNHNGAPIFTYCSLESNSPEDFYVKINAAYDTFIYIHNILMLKEAIALRSDSHIMKAVIKMDLQDYHPEWDGIKNFYEFRYKRHNFGYINFKKIEGKERGFTKSKTNVWVVKIFADFGGDKNNLSYPEIQMTPIQMAIYSYYIYQTKPVADKDICSDRELKTIKCLYDYFKQEKNEEIKNKEENESNFDKKEKRASIDKTKFKTNLHKEIDKINRNIEKTLMVDVSIKKHDRDEIKARRCYPYLISNFKREGYGILASCRGRLYNAYVDSYRGKIAPILSGKSKNANKFTD